MLKVSLALFLIAHGLVHAAIAAGPIPNDPNSGPGQFFSAATRSWLLPKLGLGDSAVQWIGIILVVVSTLGFVLTGLGIFGVAGLGGIWRSAAVFSSVVSLLLLIIFWHPWLPVGVLIDIVVIIALLMGWPSDTNF